MIVLAVREENEKQKNVIIAKSVELKVLSPVQS